MSGLVTLDRAMRARDVSRPDPEDERMASDVLSQLLARVDGRRQGRSAVWPLLVGDTGQPTVRLRS